MASFKNFAAALIAVSFVSIPATTALAVGTGCDALQKRVDAGETLTGDALMKYDECFPISVDETVTNVVPGLLPVVVGGAGAAALAVGLGGTNSTGSTSGGGS